jgi:transposase-like protein
MAMSKQSETTPPETQVTPRAKRRVFSLQYKRSIVEQADACTMPGEVGALLRREGLYSSHLTDWRKEQKRGNLEGYGRLRRGPIAKEPPVPKASDAQQRRIEQLERENQKLRLRAVKAEALVEFQKKAAALLGAEVTELRDDVC